MHWFAEELGYKGFVCELNTFDDLWTTRVTSHVALSEVAGLISEERLVPAVGLAHATLRGAGYENPRIAVAALNPHAGDGGLFGREEIDLLEVHDCFSITEALIMEDLQFSPRGKVKEDIESGFFELTGGLPVQPDGGLKSFGHPVGASGLRMMYEMYKQLQGKAGDRQIKDPKLGLTQNLGGPPTSPAIACLIAGL